MQLLVTGNIKAHCLPLSSSSIGKNLSQLYAVIVSVSVQLLTREWLCCYCYGFNVVDYTYLNAPNRRTIVSSYNTRSRTQRQQLVQQLVRPATNIIIDTSFITDELSHDHNNNCDCCAPRSSGDDRRALSVVVSKSDDTTGTLLRNVHQSTVLPNVWQQYLLPSSLQQPEQDEVEMYSANMMQNFINVIWKRQEKQDINKLDDIDVTIYWNSTMSFVDSSYDDLAKQVLNEYYHKQQLLRSRQRTIQTIRMIPPHRHQNEMIRSIADAMKTFTNFCCTTYNKSNANSSTKNHDDIDLLSFSLRLQGIFDNNDISKCPIWHVDHVVCRYVQTLYGPGTMFINNSHDNENIYHRICELYDSDSVVFSTIEEQNRYLLQKNSSNHDPILSCIEQANVGEGIILFGHEWWGNGNNDYHSSKIPTVHKSPSLPNNFATTAYTSDIIAKNYTSTNTVQGRILITMNVHI